MGSIHSLSSRPAIPPCWTGMGCHFVCYRKSLHRATPKWVVLQCLRCMTQIWSHLLCFLMCWRHLVLNSICSRNWGAYWLWHQNQTLSPAGTGEFCVILRDRPIISNRFKIITLLGFLRPHPTTPKTLRHGRGWKIMKNIATFWGPDFNKPTQPTKCPTLSRFVNPYNGRFLIMAIMAGYYTPLLWREGCNSFDIVCVPVCGSVTTFTAEWTNIQTCIPSSKCSGSTVRCSAHCRPTVKKYSVPTVRAVPNLFTHCRRQCALYLHCGNDGLEPLWLAVGTVSTLFWLCHFGLYTVVLQCTVAVGLQ